MAAVDGAPITERSNAITASIDVSSPQEIVNLLNACDDQIFSGWEVYQNVYSQDVLETMADISSLAAEIIKSAASEKTAIVLSGCGTSGRLAFMLARTCNQRLRELGIGRDVYRYIIAGGDRALFMSQEAPEDSHAAGIEALQKATLGLQRVLFIGITCGLSAPFVAGQLDYCMQHTEVFVPVLFGFNPTNLARRTTIVGWSRTFFDVACELQTLVQEKKGFILNPIIGPEAITGSTRMKSGTATKILLEAIFSCAHHAVAVVDPVLPSVQTTDALKRCIQCFELVYHSTYRHGDTMGRLIEIGGRSLASAMGGHIYYLGVGSLGVVAMIDASECPPTFGSDFSDVRAFLRNSYDCLANKEGRLDHLGRNYCIGWDEFLTAILPTLTADDVIVCILEGECCETLQDLRKQLKPYKSHHVLLFCGNPQDYSEEVPFQNGFEVELGIDLPWADLKSKWPFSFSPSTAAMFSQLSVKLVLNAMTTGAHILSGKILGNKMADLQVSNTKLYYRAIGIIEDFAGVGKAEAEQCLLSSIYGEEAGLDVDHLKSSGSVAAHVRKAAGRSKVVPAALLLASRKVGLAEAKRLLEQEPVVRKALARVERL